MIVLWVWLLVGLGNTLHALFAGDLIVQNRGREPRWFLAGSLEILFYFLFWPIQLFVMIVAYVLLALDWVLGKVVG